MSTHPELCLAEFRRMNDTLERILLVLEAPHARRAPRSEPDKRQSAAVMQGRAESAPQSLDPCFVALAEIEGSDPAKLTASSVSTLQHALREIRAVMREVTPEEIRVRAKRYKEKKPTCEWALTAMSLAKHWPKLATFSTGPAPAALVVPPEPSDWAERFATLYPTWQAMDELPQRVMREVDGAWQMLRWEHLGAVKLRGVATNFWPEFAED